MVVLAACFDQSMGVGHLVMDEKLEGSTEEDSESLVVNPENSNTRESAKATNLWHGYNGNPAWPAPKCIWKSKDKERTRQSFSDIDESEYLDSPDVLRAKVALLVKMIKKSKDFVVYSGTGILAGSGGREKGSTASPYGSGNRLLIPPTYTHHALAALERKGYLQHWLQQSHDGLAQKAGFPQNKLNEIHGSWFDKHSVGTNGGLLPDRMQILSQWRRRADFVLAVGTSLCGMAADAVAQACAARARRRTMASDPASATSQGLAILGLHRTPMDPVASLRIFARIDDAMRELANAMNLDVQTDTLCSAYPAPLGKGRRGNRTSRD